MVESVNDKIHDDLISHDIRLRRVLGDQQKRIEKRLNKLGTDLKGITAQIDPFSVNSSKEKGSRLARLGKASTELIDAAFKDISKIQSGDLERVAAIETEATVQAVRKALP